MQLLYEYFNNFWIKFIKKRLQPIFKLSCPYRHFPNMIFGFFFKFRNVFGSIIFLQCCTCCPLLLHVQTWLFIPVIILEVTTDLSDWYTVWKIFSVIETFISGCISRSFILVIFSTTNNVLRFFKWEFYNHHWIWIALSWFFI